MSYFAPKKYIKNESFDPIYSPVNSMFFFRARFIPLFSIVAGVLILATQVIFPLVVFKTSDTVASPVASSVLGRASGFSEFSFEELTETEVSDPSVLSISTQGLEPGSVVNVADSGLSLQTPDYYYLTVPKLGIKRAKVEVAPKDLDPRDALGHYIGSALPGNVGNTFIYGHSVLPWFYNPKNYKTIFSTLHELEVGDEITIDFQERSYTYAVEAKQALLPSDVNPLAEYKPRFLNESTVVLMTCSPPGAKTKRLLVYGVLKSAR